MASPLSILFLLLSACTLLSCSADPVEFRVGGPLGWRKPTGSESETYNQWASRNRFHVGDSLYFKYENDSVLLVDREDYAGCNTANPVQRFTDGNTTFSFDRYGFFYFISGEPGYCLAGEKLIVRVMVHPEMGGAAPAPEPAPAPGTAFGPVPGAGFAGGPGVEPGSRTRSGTSGQAGSSGAHSLGVGFYSVGILAMVLSWQLV